MRTRNLSAALAAVAAATLSTAGYGQLVFDSANSLVSFRHIENFGSSTSRTNTRQFAFNNTALANAFDFSSLYALNPSTTTGMAGVDPITNATTASFRLPSGTGVAQVNPSPQRYGGYSEVQISLNMVWNVGSLGLSTVLAPYSSYGLAGTVGTGPGAFARLIQDIKVEQLSASNTVLKSADLDADLTFNTAGGFAQPVTRSAIFSGGNGPLAAGTKLKISGTIKFRAKNDGSPSDILLLDGELGGSSNLYTGNFAATGSWQDSANWIASPDLPPASFPNGAVRARLVANDLNTDARTITLNAPASVLELEVDDLDSYTVNSAAPANTLSFIGAKPALSHGNANGNGTLTVNSRLAFTPDPGEDSASIRSDSTGGLHLNGGLNAAVGTTVAFDGAGPIRVTTNNAPTLSGPVVVSGRSVTTTVSGALGSGPLTVSNGQLIANATNPSTDPGAVIVNAGGQYSFGVATAPQLTETFNIATNSAIAGTPSQLNQLSATGNVSLAPDAMIVHRTRTPLVAPGQDVQNLGTTPQYIYGIGADFTDNFVVFNIDTTAATPYRGLGADRSARVFGAHPNAGTGPSTTLNLLGLVGDTSLMALPGGQLTLNTRVAGNGTVTVAGGGTVVINNVGPNTYDGTVRVTDAALVLFGGLGGNGTVSNIVLDHPSAVLQGFAPNDTPVEVIEGTIHPNNMGLGSLAIDSLNLSGGSFDAKLRFTCGRPGLNDYLNVTGPISGQATLDIDARSEFDVGLYELIRYQQGAPGVVVDLGTVPPDYVVDFVIVPDSATSSFGRGILVVSPIGVDVSTFTATGNTLFSNNAAWGNNDAPEGFGAVATFKPTNSGSLTVTLDSPRTLGTLNFLSPLQYIIAGSGTLTIAGVLDQAGINSLAGSGGHVISAPIHFETSARLNAQGGAIGLQGNMTAAAGVQLRKTGIGGLGLRHIRADELLVEDGGVGIAVQPSANAPAGTSRLKSLVLTDGTPTPSNIVVPPPSLNLANNALVIDYDDASPLSTIRQYLRNGITGTGPKIISFIPGPPPTAARLLALFEASELGLTSFAGQPLDATSLLIAYTLAGDTNLDFAVNINDFAALAVNFNQPGNSRQGDFNFDGVTNIADFASLAANFGQTLPGDVPRAAIPEPVSFFAVGLLAVLRRRR